MSEIQYCRTRSSNGVLPARDGGTPQGIRVVGSSRVIPLARTPLFVGSGRQSDIQLQDPYVSKRHFAVMQENEGIWVEDAGSRNGTWVDNVRVVRSRVSSGSRIYVGQSCLEMVGGGRSIDSYGIIGQHPSMRKVMRMIERLGPSSQPVMILGETGTGKELVARALHECSACRLGPFEPLNCGAIPRDLAEAELFGHGAGAFTGAIRERRGAFERADGGSLFLDEIGEMALDLQPKLLRVLEDGIVQRIGEEQRHHISVRIVAATHRDLLAEAQNKHFRLDLYHRLAVGVIEIPALRDRREDIPLIVQHFLSNAGTPAVPMTIDEDGLAFLTEQSWPGNVRELRNALHRALLEAGPHLRVKDLRFVAVRSGGVTAVDAGTIRFAGRAYADVRREIFVRVLDAHQGNCTAAAAALGIPKSTFYDQARTFGIR